jgi:hypothetical protein
VLPAAWTTSKGGATLNQEDCGGGVHLTSCPGARPSGRFGARKQLDQTIDVSAGDAEAAQTPRAAKLCVWGNFPDAPVAVIGLEMPMRRRLDSATQTRPMWQQQYLGV